MRCQHFTIADLNCRGELVRSAEYGYDQLAQVPGAGDLVVAFATILWREPEGFDLPIPGAEALEYRWRASAPTAGVGTLRCGGELASVCLIASGIDPEADRITLRAFQQHLLACLRNTPFEPAFELLDLSARPLVASVEFTSAAAAPAAADHRTQYLTALADRCFAAACFRRLGLL